MNADELKEMDARRIIAEIDKSRENENVKHIAPAVTNKRHGDIKEAPEERHYHYYKDVSGLEKLDIYRVLDLYEITSPCRQHAIKKMLMAGKRGSKDCAKDIQEAIDTLRRELQMLDEDGQ